MLTKTQYKELSKNWGKHSSTYQKWDRYQVRFPMLLKHIDVFKGKNVLEVGCNAGLAAYHILQVAKSYLGVEGESGYYKQSLETKNYIEQNIDKPTNIGLLNMSIKSYIKRALRGDFPIDVNAAYLSYVLYHFSDKEVKMFEEHILPKLDVIVVQSRYENRNKKGRTRHNGYRFWDPKNVEKYLNKNGFSTTVEYGPRNKFHFIIGKKDMLKGDQWTEEEMKQAEEVDRPTIVEQKLQEIDDVDTIKAASDVLTEEKLEKMGEMCIKKAGEAHKKCEKTIGFGEKKEKADGDKGSGGIYTEGESASTSGQRAPDGQARASKRKPRVSTKQQDNTQGEGKTVLPKRRRGRRPSVLLDGVEKGAKDKVRSKDVQKTKQTTRARAVSTSGKNNKSEDKSTVQKSETQS